VELRHLRYFVALAEELHFGRAARRLHLSQPPLSMQIKALEAEIGTPLLTRTRRRVELTAAGAIFLRDARDILMRVEQATASARRVGRGEIGELAVGFVTIADYNVLPRVLSEFRVQHPEVRLTLREATTDAQLRELAEQRIDIGFVLAPIHDDNVTTRPLLSEPLVAALPAHHPLARTRAALPLARLADAPFILFPRHMAPGLYDDVVGFCRLAGFIPRVEQEAVQMQTIISLVSAGLGVALIPASMRNLGRSGVVYRSLREDSPLTQVLVAWRKGDNAPVLHRFVECLERVVRSMGKRRR
jgi:DNA-binding transcriptional LysR family regulator